MQRVCIVVTAVNMVSVCWNSYGLWERAKKCACLHYGLCWNIIVIDPVFLNFCCSLFGAMFPLPRIIYAMSMDGLIFRFLGQVHHYFKTPVYGTLIAGLLTGLSES